MHNSIIFELYIDIIALKFTTNAKFEKKMARILDFLTKLKVGKKIQIQFLEHREIIRPRPKKYCTAFLRVVEWKQTVRGDFFRNSLF